MLSFLNIFYNISCLSFIIICSFAHNRTEKPRQMTTKKALVFGGNGFIGSKAVIRLVEENYRVICVSRGNWDYFDFETKIKPLVDHVKCDRLDGLENCTSFMHLLSATDHFDVVVDFSAYRPSVVEDALRTLRGKVGLYIFISTDSVYEVSVAKDPPGPSKEEDARRPESKAEQDKLNDADSYGHKKLSCEEALQNQRGEIPYVILRLPDVIGPCDTTNRWWSYQLWVQFFEYIKRPIMIPPDILHLKTSYVFVYDVAEAIILALRHEEKAKYNAFNLGFPEQFTLMKLLQEMQSYLGVGELSFDYGDNPSSFYLFPSVGRGPVDVSKAKAVLGWEATPWKQALGKTVDFYKLALSDFPKERSDAMHTILSYVINNKHKDQFLRAVEKYAINRDQNKMPREEL